MLKRNLQAVLLACLVSTSLACVQTSVPEGAGASHRYFAAVADYTTVKVIAMKYAAQPGTPLPQAEAILKVAEDGDHYVHAVDAVRRGDCSDPMLREVLSDLDLNACELTDADYSSASGALRIASSVLRQLAQEEE